MGGEQGRTLGVRLATREKNIFKEELVIMATTLEIIRGISQAAANAYDGALDDKGEPLKVGLKREEGDPILDKRVMDGFSVKFHGNLLSILYHAEVDLKNVHGSKFEGEVEQMIEDIASFLKKEYKKVTGNTLSLTKDGEASVHLEYMSRIRCWVTANCSYKIGGIDEVEPVSKDSEDRIEKNFRDFLNLGANK
jgi:hypothetical protein